MYAWNFLCRNRLKILLLSVCGSVSCGKKVSWNRPLIVVAAVAVVVVVVVTDFNVPLLLLGFFRCTRKWWDLKRTTFQTDRQERESHFWFKNGPKSCCCQNQVFQSFSIFSKSFWISFWILILNLVPIICSRFILLTYQVTLVTVWPDWAIYCTLGNFIAFGNN